MRRALILALLLPVPDAIAQQEACDQMLASLAAEPGLAAAHSSSALTTALQSPDLLWEFLIAPTTSYLDRLAAAHRGAAVFPPGFLPKIWVAMTEAGAIPSVVGESPCYRFEHHMMSFGGRTRSSLLGRKVEPARRPPTFPLNLEERERSPWEWQISRAFRILQAGLDRRYRAPREYKRLLAQAWDWEPADELEDQTRVRAIASGPVNADFLKAILRLASTNPKQNAGLVNLNAGRESIAVQAVRTLEWLDRPAPPAKDLIQVALISILQNTKDPRVACAASYSAEPGRAATILALSDWANNKAVDTWARYYCYASSVCRGMEDPPFKPEAQLNPASPEVAASLARFEDWFVANRSRLERQAELESSALNHLAAELGITLR